MINSDSTVGTHFQVSVWSLPEPTRKWRQRGVSHESLEFSGTLFETDEPQCVRSMTVTVTVTSPVATEGTGPVGEAPDTAFPQGSMHVAGDSLRAAP